MSKESIFHLRLDPDVREEINDRASDQGITPTEWIRNAIDLCIRHGIDGIPSEEAIQDMNWDELEEVIEDLGLEIDPDDYDNSGIFSDPSSEDTDNLRNEVLIELGMYDDPDDENE